MKKRRSLVLASAAGVTLGVIASIVLGPNPRAEDLSAELPRIPVTEAADTLQHFSIADGFKIDLVASEPLIGSPVAAEWDADGRLYVCEMRGYSEDRDQQLSTIARLDDRDGDGVFDSRTEFASGLDWPTAIFPFDGGLFVGDAPNLLYLKDTDGDGRADLRKVVLTGFGTSNVQGLLNSFRWGLDNRIHVACSSAAGLVRQAGAPQSQAVNVRGRDLAFDPRTFDFELTSGAAQHGMCFDDWGRKFVSSNSDHIQQVMYEERYIARNRFLRPPPARISIAADGPQAEVFRTSPVEPWRIVRTRLRVAGQVPGPIEGGGRAAGYFTGATGVTIYRGDAWPEEWHGLAIVGDVGSNLVHRKRLQSNGLEFVARRIDANREFIASHDIWFRPAQFVHGPDGALHVIDVCREVIEHPKSLPPEIKRHLDLTSGRDRGRIYRIRPDRFRDRSAGELSSAPTSDLVAMLAHRNAWHRETAARLLFEKQDRSAIPDLRRMIAESEAPLGKLHAMYALLGMGALDAPSVLHGLRGDHPQLRKHAVRLSESISITPDLEQQLTAMTDDPSLDVRYQLAFTIGNLDVAHPDEILADVLAVDHGDRWVQAAVQSSLSRGVAGLFENLIENKGARSAAFGDFLHRLAEQIRQQDDEGEVTATVGILSKLTGDQASFALPIVGEFLRGREKEGSTLARLDDAGELAELDRSVGKMIEEMIRIAKDGEAPLAQRIEALDALAFSSFAPVRPTLISLVDSRQPHELQRAAVATLGKFRDPEVAETLISAWRTFSPRLRQSASEVLFARPERTLALFDAIDSGEIPLNTLEPTRLQLASRSSDKAVRTRASKYQRSATVARRPEVVQRYREALSISGDRVRGKAWFKKHCAACHRAEGVGHELGPNLATIKSRGAETILVNLLDPNREVNPQYLNYVALTVDGRVVTGMIAAESASSLTLARGDKQSDALLRIDIERLQSTNLSLMPEGLENQLDVQAVADLIAYLMGL